MDGWKDGWMDGWLGAHRWIDQKVQVAAVLSLGSGGQAAAPYVPDVAELFKDKRWIDP